MVDFVNLTAQPTALRTDNEIDRVGPARPCCDRNVAQALASRRSPGARSSGAALADARLWAKAQAAGICWVACVEQNDRVAVHVHMYGLKTTPAESPVRDCRFLSRTRRLADARSSTAGCPRDDNQPVDHSKKTTIVGLAGELRALAYAWERA